MKGRKREEKTRSRWRMLNILRIIKRRRCCRHHCRSSLLLIFIREKLDSRFVILHSTFQLKIINIRTDLQFNYRETVWRYRVGSKNNNLNSLVGTRLHCRSDFIHTHAQDLSEPEIPRAPRPIFLIFFFPPTVYSLAKFLAIYEITSCLAPARVA